MMEFGLFPNMGKMKLYDFFPKFLKLLERKNINFYITEDVKQRFEAKGIFISEEHYKSVQWIGEHVKYVFSIGGDGSFLEASKAFSRYSVFLVGIHLGDLGFLNSILMENVEQRIEQILHEEYILESKTFLASFLIHQDRTKEALPAVINDIVIGRTEIGKMVRIQLWINNVFAQQYPCDGLIISTATGSTGYAFSCGGPILHPSSNELLVVPISAHTLSKFSAVLSNDAQIKVTLPEREKEVRISADGNGCYCMKQSDTLIIKCCKRPIRFIRFRDQDFWNDLTEKLVHKS